MPPKRHIDEAQLSYAAIRQRYLEAARPFPSALEAQLRADPRPAAKAIVLELDRRRGAERSEGQRLRTILRFERDLWKQGVVHVAGVDEAGMSPLAGPVAAGAVIFRPGFRLAGIDDSKKLSAQERERLVPLIQESALAWAVGFVEPEEIDRVNIYWAGILAMKRALSGLSVVPSHVLVDGRKIEALSVPQTRIDKGDQKSITIAAASILAKTARDARMVAYDREFPMYGFSAHKGYPVRAHRDALVRHGACPIHRRSFAAVREALALPPLGPWPTKEERPADAAFAELARVFPADSSASN